MSLIILKELEYYTTNVCPPFKKTDLIYQLGLTGDIERYKKVVEELLNTSFFKYRKPKQQIKELETNYKDELASNEEEIPSNLTNKESFQFSYVGVIIIKGITLIIYPKYIENIKLDKRNNYVKFKQILQVIYHYQKKQKKNQNLALTLEEMINEENQLGLSIQILNHFNEYGLYEVEGNLLEINGEGEINWTKTINETRLVLSGNSPIYLETYTDTNLVDESNILRLIQSAILNNIKEKYKDILVLLEYEVPNIGSVTMEDLGSKEELLYFLDKELSTQFVTHNIELIYLLQLFIIKKIRDVDIDSITIFGANKFEQVWEEVCKIVYGDDLEKTLDSLGLLDIYGNKSRKKLKESIPKPLWKDLSNYRTYLSNKSLELDVLHVNKDKHMFEIYDGKYYTLIFENDKVKKQPGIEDVTKQFLYELAFVKLARANNNYGITNKFIIPKDDLNEDNGLGVEVAEVTIPLFDNLNLSPIKVIARNCETIFSQYLNIYK
ncbi:LlaJI family restriction endonuclease [Staphylococcus xylosus]